MQCRHSDRPCARPGGGRPPKRPAARPPAGIVTDDRRQTSASKTIHSSFSRCGDIVGAHQNLNGLPDLTTPLSGIDCYPWATKFEVSISTHYKDTKGDRKYRKWGGLGSYGSLKVAENSAVR